MRVFHANLPAADVTNAPGVSTQQEDVAGEAFHREILIEGADHLAFGLDDDGVGGGVGDRAA